MLLSFQIFIKSEPIMFSLRSNNEEEALVLIDKVYDQSEDRQVILEKLKL